MVKPNCREEIGCVASPSLIEVIEFVKQNLTKSLTINPISTDIITQLDGFKDSNCDPLAICLDFEPYRQCFSNIWKTFTNDILEFTSI